MRKARKRRRPNTMYKSKEIATGTVGNAALMAGRVGVMEGSQQGGSGTNAMTEALIRLKRLKAMSTRNNI